MLNKDSMNHYQGVQEQWQRRRRHPTSHRRHYEHESDRDLTPPGIQVHSLSSRSGRERTTTRTTSARTRSARASLPGARAVRSSAVSLPYSRARLEPTEYGSLPSFHYRVGHDCHRGRAEEERPGHGQEVTSTNGTASSKREFVLAIIDNALRIISDDLAEDAVYEDDRAMY